VVWIGLQAVVFYAFQVNQLRPPARGCYIVQSTLSLCLHRKHGDCDNGLINTYAGSRPKAYPSFVQL
jgi:hypothetical protein